MKLSTLVTKYREILIFTLADIIYPQQCMMPNLLDDNENNAMCILPVSSGFLQLKLQEITMNRLKLKIKLVFYAN